ncbi:hypothetical protein X943_000259 [Babesia divergens]|uniref:Nucleolar complex-associated protein 3 N-terminal domain-containing protein n=1 Tax=Babesia divergens TaxID=32595 RepID=A0AAD9LJ26_BABDI|nr:hypothetical protein X943_000259 [Babesia divergens]
MPPIRHKGDIKKARRKTQSLQGGKGKRKAKGKAHDQAATNASITEYNIEKLATLEAYKRFIANICTEATSNPENGINPVFLLFDLVAMRGGGTTELKTYVKNITLRSLVAVAVHLIPRISYELLQEDEPVQDGDDTTSSTATTKKKGTTKPTTKPAVLSNLVENERTVSKKVVELRNRLIDHCASQLHSEPTVIIPMIARLTSADNKPHEKLLRLCMECCNLGYDELTQICLNSVREVVAHASITDLERAIKVLLKSNNKHAGVLRIINDIPLAKRQHTFELLNEKGTSNKHMEEILTAVISYYLRILAQCKGETLEECLSGLARFGVLVNETLQKEILGKMKDVMQKAHTLQPFTHVRVLQTATMLSRSLKLKSDWIVQEFTRMVHTTAPYLCQGQILDKGEYMQFSQPCYTRDVIRTVQVVVSHAISSVTNSETEDLVRLTQELLSLAIVVDTAASQALLQEVCHVLEKVPQVGGILDAEGIIFSVLAKRATSFWELQLLLNHSAPHIATVAKRLKNHAINDTMERLKAVGSERSKRMKCANNDIASCGADIHEMLLVKEHEMFSQYRPKENALESQ